MEVFESRWNKIWLKNHVCALVRLYKQEEVVRSKWTHMERSRFKRDLNFIKVVE